MTYDEHVGALLKSHRIRELRVEDYRQASANVEWRSVKIPKVVNGLTYLVALHEIGHIMTNDKRCGKLLREAAAWKWAIAEAMIPITQDDWHEGFMSLQTYIQQRQNSLELGFTAADGRRGEFRIPPKNHWFWEIHEALAIRAGV